MTQSWSPLGQGGDILQDATVLRVAEKHGATAGQAILAWHLRHGFSVIPKSADPDRLAQNFGALELKLDEEDVAALTQDLEEMERMVAAYREPNKTTGKQRMRAVIESVASGVPDALVEIRTLGRTLKQRAADVLAFFDRPGTSNGPTEAINGRLEHLRGSALGFRNLTHYIARSLLEAGGFRPRLHPQLR